MRRFARFACIDWSGAATPRQPGIAIATCERSDKGSAPAPELVPPPSPHRHWTRGDVLAWLLAHAADDLLIGVDFSTALPFDRDDFYLGCTGPRSASALWQEVDETCSDDPHLAATSFVRRADFARLSRVGTIKGEAFDHPGDPNGRRRLVEREEASGHAASCYNLVGAKQVGRSSLTGMRVLHRLRGAIPVWPFEAPRSRGAAIVEIYTSIAAAAALPRPGRSKITDGGDLDRALAALRSAPYCHNGPIGDHSSDAILTAAWLRRRADDPALWERPGDPIALAEGWTFGVPYRKEAPGPA